MGHQPKDLSLANCKVTHIQQPPHLLPFISSLYSAVQFGESSSLHHFSAPPKSLQLLPSTSHTKPHASAPSFAIQHTEIHGSISNNVQSLLRNLNTSLNNCLRQSTYAWSHRQTTLLNYAPKSILCLSISDQYLLAPSQVSSAHPCAESTSHNLNTTAKNFHKLSTTS